MTRGRAPLRAVAADGWTPLRAGEARGRRAAATHPPFPPSSPCCSEHARGIPGKAQLFINAFARALEVIPRQLADNSGFDATGAHRRRGPVALA